MRDRYAMFSVQAPAVYQHLLSLGASWKLSRSVILNATWVHGFNNAVQGPFILPTGPVPGSVVKVSQTVDSAIMGVSFLF